MCHRHSINEVKREPKITKKYQKCAENIMPANGAAPMTPFWLVLNFKSQSVTGNTKAMPTLSIIVANMLKPHMNIKK